MACVEMRKQGGVVLAVIPPGDAVGLHLQTSSERLYYVCVGCMLYPHLTRRYW
jgi:hypothetical protein